MMSLDIVRSLSSVSGLSVLTRQLSMQYTMSFQSFRSTENNPMRAVRVNKNSKVVAWTFK